MKNITKYILIFWVAIAFSCSDSIMDEIDTNPNVFSDAPLNTLLPNVITRYTTEVAGGATARTARFLSEQTTFVLGGPILDGLSSNSTLWQSGYLALNDLEIIKKKAQESGAWAYVGISGVLKAFYLSNITDLYGDVPYSEALRPEIVNPRFDSSESIYAELQNILDEAITNLEKDPGLIIPRNDDMIFNGNRAMWIKTAYGLKARLHNRLSNIDPQGSANKALEAIGKSFSTENERFMFSKFENTLNNGNPHSLAQNAQPMTSVGNGIFNAMLFFSPNGNVEDDPRANIWFTRVKGKLLPAPNGTAVSDFQEPRLDGAFYSKPEILKHFGAPKPLLTFVEIKFIEAECYLRLGNPQSAYASYQTALSAALKEASIFRPAVALSPKQMSDYISLPTVSPGIGSLTQKTVVYQKYIYFFLYQPIEAYNEFRRTGLFAVTDPGGSATRFPYPIIELTRNRNTPTGIDDFTILNRSTKLFWAK
ncbi:MAG: hypothetical protein C0433_19635 [Cyclobacterium sp.]|nr:hypothetical protein [Cyclobacterium sp.]